MKKILAFLLVAVSTYYSKAQTSDSLDGTFGVNGRATGFTTNGAWLNVRNLQVQPDGKIIQVSSTSNSGFMAVRYNANGSSDNSYGANSIATAFIGQNTEASGGVLQSDGKLVVAGTLYTPEAPSHIALARFNSDGTPDSAFGTKGKVVTLVGSYNNAARGLAIQPDGKIVVAGYSSGDCFIDCINRPFCRPLVTLLRYHPNGSADSSFGQNGSIVFGTGSFNSGIASSILIQPDGKIIAFGDLLTYFCESCSAGTTNASGIFMARYLPNGMPDNSFGLNGKVMDQGLQNLSAALLQPDGRIVLTASNFRDGFLTRQYNTDGSVDPTFTQSVITPGPINTMLLLPDGKLALAGGANINNQKNFLIVRLKNNGAFDSSFHKTGRFHIRVGVPSNSDEGATGLALQGAQLLAGGYTQFYSSQNSGNQFNQVVVRLGTVVGSPLPLTLLNLSAHLVEYEVDVKWQTQNEVNRTGFQIERSIDGRTFSLIGFLTASGSLSGINNYIFRDKHPFNGTNYYRIKMIDADGKFIYSKVVAVQMDNKGSLQIFPNPATNTLFVQATGVNEKATLQIVDVSGRKLKEEKIILNGNTSYTVDIKDLPKGLYYLLLSTSSKMERVKFMKQ